MDEHGIQQGRRHLAAPRDSEHFAKQLFFIFTSHPAGKTILKRWAAAMLSNVLGLFMRCGKEMASLRHYMPSTSEVTRPAKRHKPWFVSGLSLSPDVKCLSLMMLQHKSAVFPSVPFMEIDFFHIAISSELCSLVCQDCGKAQNLSLPLRQLG